MTKLEVLNAVKLDLLKLADTLVSEAEGQQDIADEAVARGYSPEVVGMAKILPMVLADYAALVLNIHAKYELIAKTEVCLN